MRGKWVAGAAGPLLALAFWAGVRIGERRAPAPKAVAPAGASASACVVPQEKAGQGPLSPEELKAAIEEQSDALRQRAASAEGRREVLKSVVRFELLAREAVRKGYGRDPELARQSKRALVARFLERELDEPLSRQPVEEAELRTYYEAHRADYLRPERVHLCDRLFQSSPGGAADRTRAKAAALVSLADARQGEGSPSDLGFLTRAELEVKAGPAVAAAAFEPAAGQSASAGLTIETPQGVHAVRLLGRESALDLRLEDVRESIRRRILFERKARAHEELARELEARAGASDSAFLDSLVLEAVHTP